MRAAVIGAAGYAGGELLRLVLQHPEVDECIATSRSQAGVPVSEIHPGLATVTDARFAGLTPGEAAKGRDIVFLALEHGESSRVMGEILDQGPGLVVDLAADFRLQDGQLYAQHYGVHPAPDLVHLFRYALADVIGCDLRGARGLAAPGCFATAAQLALFPLRTLPLATPPSIFAVTGSTGAGVTPRSTTHHPARAHNLFAYGVMSHRHEAEVLEQWRGWIGQGEGGPRLMVHAGPFVRGIALTLHARLGSPDDGSVAQAFRDAYATKPMVRLLDSPPHLTHAIGTNLALISHAVSPDRTEIQVMVAIDNLIKGAGGQAIQALNLALGFPESTGLMTSSPYPS